MKLCIFPKAFPAVLAGAMLANLCAFLPLRASGAPTGLAYDQITRVVLGKSVPEPGTFPADFDAAVNAQKSLAAPGKHRGLFGGLMNTVDVAKNAMSIVQNGTASSQYYLGSWERTDDPGAQTAVINKPQQHQIMYLNVAKKTYRVVDTNVQTSNEAPPPMQNPHSPAGPPPQPGSGKLNITVATTSLGPKVIDNIPTTGYKVTFNLTESKSTGSCTDGTFQTSMVEYVSRYAQPRVTASHMATPRATGMRPEMMALKPGCSPVISMHASGGARPAADRLPVWMLVTISAGAPTAQGQMSGGFSTLIERGNVRQLGTADKQLFDIPADFTKEQ